MFTEQRQLQAGTDRVGSSQTYSDRAQPVSLHMTQRSDVMTSQIPIQQNGGSREDSAFNRFRSRSKKWSKSGIKQKHFERIGKMIDVLLIYTTSTMLYVGYRILVPYFFDQFGGWATYYMKVFITFVYVEAMANWACVKYYTSEYANTSDRSDSEREIWLPDEQALQIYNMQMQQMRSQQHKVSLLNNPKLMYNGSEVEEKWAELLDKERAVLSWRWCIYCQEKCPPRTHHCKICNVCILKRDHHCYLTNVCIGFNNQRFFAVLCFYIAFACHGALGFGLTFLFKEYYGEASLWDYFLPVTIYQWYYGVYPLDVVFMITHLYLLPPIGFMCLGFFVFQIALIATGKTPFELLKRLHLRNSYSVSRNIRSVFGKYWFMNFIIPFHLVYRQTDDPTSWPNLKIYYKGNLQGEKIVKNVTI